MSVLRPIAFMLLATGCQRCDAQRTPHSVPKLVVEHAERTPIIDGVLSDAAWEHASSTGPFLHPRRTAPAPFAASAKMLWDERYLYVGVEVNDDLLTASDTEHDAHLWTQDCVELMIAPRGSLPGYFEIEVSPRGIVFDTRFESRREPAPFGHVAWDGQVDVAVTLRGEIGDQEPDGGYTVEMAVPWQAFSPGEPESRPPAFGEEWRANVFVLDLSDKGQQAVAWSPPDVPDFHVPARFGRLVFDGRERLESPRAPH
ncbi:MAG: carbohydrate-binding family 9-like protein [Myxococcales bacterium]|jgi:hypothetical protein